MDAWTEAGIPVTTFWIGDPMSWNTPREVERTVAAFQEAARRSGATTCTSTTPAAPPSSSAYQAFRLLDERHTLVLDTGIGGMVAARTAATAAPPSASPLRIWVDLLHEEGVDTGIDLRALIEAAHLAEEVVGHGFPAAR